MLPRLAEACVRSIGKVTYRSVEIDGEGNFARRTEEVGKKLGKRQGARILCWIFLTVPLCSPLRPSARNLFLSLENLARWGHGRPMPKARGETFSPGAAWRRLYSLKTILLSTSRTVSAEMPSATNMPGSRHRRRSGAGCGRARRREAGCPGRSGSGANSALGGFSIVFQGMISPSRLIQRASS